MNRRERERRVHLAHCGFGEYPTTCKYGQDETCPGLREPEERPKRKPPPDALELVLRPIVEGQVRSFANDHPEVIEAVNWYRRRADRRLTFVNSVSKRILRDLLCPETRMRLMAALVESPTASAVEAGPITLSGLDENEGGVTGYCPRG